MESETARKEYQLLDKEIMINISLLRFSEEHGLIKYVNLSFEYRRIVGQVVGGVGASEIW